MTHYHAQAGGHKLRVLTHETDLPVVVKLSCGAVAGAVAQTGRLTSLYVLVSYQTSRSHGQAHQWDLGTRLFTFLCSCNFRALCYVGGGGGGALKCPKIESGFNRPTLFPGSLSFSSLVVEERDGRQRRETLETR